MVTLVPNECLGLKSNGELDEYKARIVAKRYEQVEGIDLSETFSLAIKPQTICLVLSLALSQGLGFKAICCEQCPFKWRTSGEDIHEANIGI